MGHRGDSGDTEKGERQMRVMAGTRARTRVRGRHVRRGGRDRREGQGPGPSEAEERPLV